MSKKLSTKKPTIGTHVIVTKRLKSDGDGVPPKGVYEVVDRYRSTTGHIAAKHGKVVWILAPGEFEEIATPPPKKPVKKPTKKKATKKAPNKPTKNRLLPNSPLPPSDHVNWDAINTLLNIIINKV